MNEYIIACKIERGGFKSERTFEIEQSTRVPHIGIAYVEHFLSGEKELLGAGEPPAGQSILGFVKCRIIRASESGEVLVQVPSGELLTLNKNKIQSIHCANFELVGK